MTRRRASLVAVLLAIVLPVGAAVLAGAAGAQTPTTAPTTTTVPPSTPTTVDTGTVPVTQDGTGKALLIGGAFVAIILIGVVVARLLPERHPHPQPTPRLAADERTRPLLFDQDHTDGSGQPTAPGSASSSPLRPPPPRPVRREHR